VPPVEQMKGYEGIRASEAPETDVSCDMRCLRMPRAALLHFALFTSVMGLSGCAGSTPGAISPLEFAPDAFVRELKLRVPDIPEALATSPYVLDEKIVARAEAYLMQAPTGPPRVQALVDFLSEPAPVGLGLVYDWSATGGAALTLKRGRGNCVSLAAVLVALGRGMDWPIYFAQARTRRPQTQEFEDVTALSDHMVVLIVPKTFKMAVDFTGLLDEVGHIRPINDLEAYAHMLNNISAQSLMSPDQAPTDSQWKASVSGFKLVTRIDPKLGRAWNNLGIALTRLAQFDEAREAYQRAVELNTAFGSAERNLTMMETRLLGTKMMGDAAGQTSLPEQVQFPE